MAKKTVNLKISNKQYTESLEPKGEAFARELSLEDSIEIDTEGVLYSKGAATYITYEESEEAGLENNKTLIKLLDGKLRIRRFGRDEASGDMDLMLEEGVMNITRYYVPSSRLDMEIYTNKVSGELSEDGYGTIYADYSIRMEPFLNRRNKLEIEVKPSGTTSA